MLLRKPMTEEQKVHQKKGVKAAEKIAEKRGAFPGKPLEKRDLFIPYTRSVFPEGIRAREAQQVWNGT